jgi:hypothetical protein
LLVTDGTQDNQTKGVPNGGWAGSNHATVLNDIANTYPSACANLKNRGIIISVLYIPYQKIKPVNSSFAGDEDDYANNNIPNIPPSLQACASPNFFFAANTPADVTTALNAMFQQSLVTAHTTNRAWGLLRTPHSRQALAKRRPRQCRSFFSHLAGLFLPGFNPPITGSHRWLGTGTLHRRRHRPAGCGCIP